MLKRPSAAEPVVDVIELEHSVLYYKNNHRIGIRQKAGEKRQVFSFGGADCKLTEEELRTLGKEACSKLATGWSEHGTHEWCLSALR